MSKDNNECKKNGEKQKLLWVCSCEIKKSSHHLFSEGST